VLKAERRIAPTQITIRTRFERVSFMPDFFPEPIIVMALK
jgi:hypothetical protein